VAKNDALTCDNIERKKTEEASSAIIIVRTKEDKGKKAGEATKIDNERATITK